MKVSFVKTLEVVPTPVNGVAIQCVNTHCIPQSLPVIDVQTEIVQPTVIPSPVVQPAAEIPSAPVNSTPQTAGAAVVIVQPAPVAVVDNSLEFDDSDIRFDDVYLPRLNLVHNVGDLMKIFEPGEIVLNGTFVIHTPANPPKRPTGNPPLNITVVGFRKKQFVEKVVGGANGLLFNTEAEVAKAGGTLSYKEWDQSVIANKANPVIPAFKYFQPLGTAIIFIERPEHLKDEGNIQFPYECEGRWFALALWGMKGTAYTHAAKHFFTARKIGHLRNGYATRSWELTTKLESFGSNVTWIPVVKPAQQNSETFISFIRNVIGCGSK